MTGEEDARPAGVPPRGSGNLLRWILLGAAVLTVALLGVFALTLDPDEPIDRSGELPEPASPRVEPLVAPGEGGIGWTWVNPLPRAMPSWYDVDVAGPDLVAMVGFGGSAASFAGGTMFRWDTATDVSLHGVAWSGPREAVVVGDGGTIRVLRRDGDTRIVEAGTDEDLRGVLTVSMTEAYVVGDGGTLLRLSAHRASTVDSGTDAALLAAHRRGDRVWVVGESGTILRIEDGRVAAAETSGTEVTLRAVGGCSDGPLYAAGDDGRVLRRTADGRWRRVDVESREPWSSVACDAGRAVIAGLRGGVLLASGARTVQLETGTDRSLHAVSGARDADTWIVGDGGRLMKVAGDHVRTLTAGPTGPIQDMGTLGGALVAVGEWGGILREREGGGFEEARSPTKAAIAAVAPLGEDALFGVGDFGAMVRIRWDGAELIESPVGDSLRDVVTDGEQRILAVGVGGLVVRGAPGSFHASRLADAGDLWALSGSPAFAVAVGDGGLVVRMDEEHSERVACDVEVSLRGVHHARAGTWAVGTDGMIVRIGDDGCAVERVERGARTLNGVGYGPNGRPLAVGDGGIALERGETGEWQPAGLDAGRANLRDVVRTDRDVYVVGAGGVIVRHVRLDGD